MPRWDAKFAEPVDRLVKEMDIVMVPMPRPAATMLLEHIETQRPLLLLTGVLLLLRNGLRDALKSEKS